MAELIFKLKGEFNDLEEIARRVVSEFHDIRVLLLIGELGAGKTSLTKKILEVLGVNADVNSPTFNLVNTYKNSKGDVFHHFDLYRINNTAELHEIGFTEYLDSGHLCIIEWPEIASGIFNEKILCLNITYDDDSRNYELLRLIEF